MDMEAIAVSSDSSSESESSLLLWPSSSSEGASETSDLADDGSVSVPKI